jgi:hypothetical protein
MAEIKKKRPENAPTPMHEVERVGRKDMSRQDCTSAIQSRHVASVAMRLSGQLKSRSRRSVGHLSLGAQIFQQTSLLDRPQPL